MAARALINLFRTLNPRLLHRKDRGRPPKKERNDQDDEDDSEENSGEGYGSDSDESGSEGEEDEDEGTTSRWALAEIKMRVYIWV